MATFMPYVRVSPRRRIATTAHDTLLMARRNLQVMGRLPALVVFSTIQPIIFVLIFRYVIGGAIVVGHVDYVEYLLPGIFVQTMVFGGLATIIGLADDLRRGIVERFRSLPMAPSAFLAGRTCSDLVRNLAVLGLMVTVGYAVGFRIRTGLPETLAALVLLATFAYSISWVYALISLWARTPETAQAASFPLLFALVFASSAFVPIRTMPGWLQPWASEQPVTVTVDAVRGLLLGGPVADSYAKSLGWCALLLATCVPLAVNRYNRAR
jgi:ABC-2 type transport system permease protein/oleandomycin transport system permease protein